MHVHDARPRREPNYARRAPERTPLHVVVREHLETFLRAAREARGRGLPRYVEDELRRYLRCGLLCHGFVRVRCPACREELLVAFSCKCRGSCPSCGSRRMCGTAAHLVDHVLPDAPVRQWVLTAPHDVRRLLALHPAALTAMNRIFASEVARWQKATSRAEGGETGSVTFVQRFDSRLGCFVHLHVLALDGVFTDRGDDAVDFHPGRALSWAEVREVARRVGVRMARWLRRRGFIGERAEDEREEQPAPSALEACMRAGGTYARMDVDLPQACLLYTSRCV